MQSLSWSLSLTMQSLSLSLLLKSLFLSWSLNKGPWSCPCDCVQFYLKVNLLKRPGWSELQLAPSESRHVYV